MANCAKVILKNKEVRSNTGSPPGPTGLTSSEDAALPLLLPTAKVEETCKSVRRAIVKERPLLDYDSISYMRLSLLTQKLADNDGRMYSRWAVNMDVSFNDNPEFKKFKWRATNKRSEFYANLLPGWESDAAYGNAWEFYNQLEVAKWIGKATYRLNYRSKISKMNLAEFTAIVMYSDGEDMFYKLWIEDAEVEGRFNIESASRFYTAASEPIKNFKVTTRRVIEL